MSEQDVRPIPSGHGYPPDRDTPTWVDRLDRLLGPLMACMVVLIAVGTVATIIIVSNTDDTTSRLDKSDVVSTCKSQFANEREGARAALEVAIGDLIVISSRDQDTTEAVKKIETTSSDLLEVIDDYDRVLDLPQAKFLAECARRFS